MVEDEFRVAVWFILGAIHCGKQRVSILRIWITWILRFSTLTYDTIQQLIPPNHHIREAMPRKKLKSSQFAESLSLSKRFSVMGFWRTEPWISRFKSLIPNFRYCNRFRRRHIAKSIGTSFQAKGLDTQIIQSRKLAYSQSRVESRPFTPKLSRATQIIQTRKKVGLYSNYPE